MELRRYGAAAQRTRVSTSGESALMIATRILAAGMIGACLFLNLARPATAAMAPTCQILSPGGATSCPATAPMFGVPGQYNYGDAFTSPAASGAIGGSDIYGGSSYGSLGSAGFIDDYLFQIAPSKADAVSATISNSDFAVTNLFATLYSLSSNPGGLALTQPVGTVYYGQVTESGPATLIQIDPVTLAGGSYVLQISGAASGPSGGSYTGTLNLSPVPLPPSFPLLLTGLLGFAGLVLPRSRKH